MNRFLLDFRLWLHRLTYSKILSFVGLAGIFVGAIDTGLFDGYPRIKAAWLVISGFVIALGRGLAQLDPDKLQQLRQEKMK